MVSVNLSAAEGGGRTGKAAVELPAALAFRSSLPLSSLSSSSPSSMALAGAASPLLAAIAECSFDDPSRKIRKPYTITKSRESWSDQEHDRFLEALQLFDRDWKKIEAFVGSKTVIQIRSHAQKYFQKVQKNGTTEHVPPPRPKRKAAHPYPQKASKNAPQQSQAANPMQASCLPDPAYLTADISSLFRNTTSSGTVSSCPHSSVQPVGVSQLKDDLIMKKPVVGSSYCGSSMETPSTSWPNSEMSNKENNVTPLRATPDFAQVLLLMRNLSNNLISPEFEVHRRLLSSYSAGVPEVKSSCAKNMIHETSYKNSVYG